MDLGLPLVLVFLVAVPLLYQMGYISKLPKIDMEPASGADGPANGGRGPAGAGRGPASGGGRPSVGDNGPATGGRGPNHEDWHPHLAFKPQICGNVAPKYYSYGKHYDYSLPPRGQMIPAGPRELNDEATPAGPREQDDAATKEDRILVGDPVYKHGFPWQILLRKKTDRTLHCGAVLIPDSEDNEIESRFLITTASCVAKHGTQQIDFKLEAAAGVDNPNSGIDQVQPIKWMRKHEKYTGDPNRYNIAILELEAPFKFNQEVRPICLPPESVSDTPVGYVCAATGWGDRGGKATATLRVVDLKVQVPETCKKQPVFGSIFNYDEMICARQTRDQKGSAKGQFCRGDNGGAFACDIGGRFVFTAAISNNLQEQDCTEKEDVFMFPRIGKFRGWIDTKIRDFKRLAAGSVGAFGDDTGSIGTVGGRSEDDGFGGLGGGRSDHGGFGILGGENGRIPTGGRSRIPNFGGRSRVPKGGRSGIPKPAGGSSRDQDRIRRRPRFEGAKDEPVFLHREGGQDETSPVQVEEGDRKEKGAE